MSMLNELAEEVAARVLLMRKLQRLVTSQKFLSVFEDLSSADKEEARAFILAGDVNGLNTFLIGKAERALGTLPIAILRARASQLGVPYYQKLPKALLLSEIQKHEEARANLRRHHTASTREAEATS